jgi:hypothetical protein
MMMNTLHPPPIHLVNGDGHNTRAQKQRRLAAWMTKEALNNIIAGQGY